jgi:hypothetical protein
MSYIDVYTGSTSRSGNIVNGNQKEQPESSSEIRSWSFEPLVFSQLTKPLNSPPAFRDAPVSKCQHAGTSNKSLVKPVDRTICRL